MFRFTDIIGDLLIDAIHNHENQFMPEFFEGMENINILDDENLIAPSMPLLEAESVVGEAVSNENAVIDYTFSESSSDDNVDVEK